MNGAQHTEDENNQNPLGKNKALNLLKDRQMKYFWEQAMNLS